jgi:hypothetical protein
VLQSGSPEKAPGLELLETLRGRSKTHPVGKDETSGWASQI